MEQDYKQFARYLKKNGIFGIFMENLYDGNINKIYSSSTSGHLITYFEYVDNCKNLNHIVDVIGLAFHWGRTKQGFDFWQEHGAKYYHMLIRRGKITNSSTKH